ncbi:MAG: hypothetical protein WBN02_00760 [Sedimenticolaceae bacterium]|jgi:predicted PurR-regulated permease PerM
MPAEPLARPNDEWSGKVAETAIRLGVLAVVLVWCFQILQPFILPFLWAVLITAGSLVILMIPTALLTEQPLVKAIGLWLVDVAASAGIGILIFVAAFVIAGILLAHSAQGSGPCYAGYPRSQNSAWVQS